MHSKASAPPRTATYRRTMDLHGIYEISKILCRPDSLPRILRSTLEVLDGFLEMSTGMVCLLDEQGDAELVLSGRLNDEDAATCFAALPERAIGQMVVGRMALLVEDVATDTQFKPWDTSLWGPGNGHFTFIGVPILERDHTIGLLVVARPKVEHTPVDPDEEPSVEPDGDVRFLQMVANLAGQTVRLHRVLARDREKLIEEQRRFEKVTMQGPIVGTKSGIVGTSPALRAVVQKVQVAARRDVTVLLRGESGTGKELFARALHTLSPRKDGPFVTLNCAALPESVLESELFGHEKGAFTGALATRKGRFELADNGTLFLDEIGEISGAFQAKLLRVLQEGEFERVGGNRTLKVNVRLVAATNRNLEDAVAKGTFRADLYYRISVVPILLPPLRDRKSDIPALADAFLTNFNKENATGIVLDRRAYDVLMQCNFPGNVRELENCIRRTATLAAGDLISESDFACKNDGCLSALLWKPPLVHIPLPVVQRPAAAAEAPPACEQAETCTLQSGKGERDRLVEAMERTGWVQAKAARLLNMTPRQIGYALRKHGIPIQKL